MAHVSVDIDIDDYLDEASTSELKNEMNNRGYAVNKKQIEKNGITFSLEGDELKRHLCDIIEVSYYTQIDEILNELKRKL